MPSSIKTHGKHLLSQTCCPNVSQYIIPLVFTSLHAIGSDFCPSSQALIQVVKALAPPHQTYALIGHLARSRRACSQCAGGGSRALGGSSEKAHWWQHGAVARAQYNEENPVSPYRVTLAKGEKERER